jgi:hypothetical protein
MSSILELPPETRNPRPVSIPTGNRTRPRAVLPQGCRAAVESTRRGRNHVAIGFWLGGLALATVGCILGARMPCSHPVAVTISVLWWGVYLGCFGASIGAAVGLLVGRSRDHRLASLPPAYASGDRPQVQAASGATVHADLVTRPVLDDDDFDILSSGMGI